MTSAQRDVEILTRAAVDVRITREDTPGFDGYGCVWGVRDTYGTEFAPGCFREGGLDAEPYALLWMHDAWSPVGTFTATEDDHGLRIAGTWDTTSAGNDARARALSGSAPGLSVGFTVIASDPDDANIFTACKLVETSQITRRMASVPGAELTEARMRAGSVGRRVKLARAALAVCVPHR
jgi:HK97 family phage prohead protease